MTVASEPRAGAQLARIEQAKALVAARTAEAPDVGVVLGSGLGAWAERLEQKLAIPYADIPHMPRPHVAGHAGTLWLGRAGGRRVACLQGRVHAYEGHPVAD